MKRYAFVLFLSLWAVLAVCAGGTKEADHISGIWYGGSSFPDNAGFKYIYCFTPVEAGRWQVFCFPASNPGNYGSFVLMTPFAGEILKSASGYELRLVSLGTPSAEVPPKDLPVVVGGRAALTIVGANEIKLVYDAAGEYAWGKTPFVDNAVAWAYRPGNGDPVPETLYRVQTTVAVNFK